ERIDHHYEKVHFDNNGDESWRGEGPSKGKGIDPKNWGTLRIKPSELDVNAQRDDKK
ncbi:hypothetical protein L208DRAFT_1320369, partial [Tricholoma matsutake]